MPPAAKREYFTGSVKDRDLDFWIQMGYNAMFVGRHGVGKTNLIQKAFERNNLKWRYWSASTMDPWTDFVGVPKEKTDENGLNYLDFVLPRDMADNSIEAMFFDEFNRAPKKVRNAVMELIQFKSINGRKFPNLKMIWTAVNPDDDDDLDFDVEPLDPAQEDRFQIQIEIPYKPSLAYFQDKYGTESGKAAVDWWDGLAEDMQRLISPRRLDYAVQVHHDSGSMRHVLPAKAPISKLSEALQHGPPEQTIRKFMANNDESGARRWLAHMNNLDGVKGLIVEDEEIRSFALPLLGPELITKLMSKNKAIKNEITQHPLKYPDIIRDVANGSQIQKIKKEFQAILKTLEQMEAAVDGYDDNIAGVVIDNSKKLPQHFTKSEQQHMRVNFRFKDKNGDYDISNEDFSGNDIETRIREIATQTMGASNSWLKSKVYDGLTTLATEDLSDDQAIAVVRLCNWLAAKHQADSLSAMDELPVIFNTAVHCILRDRPDYSVENMFEIAPYFFFRYFSNKNEKLPENNNKLIVEAKPTEEWESIEEEELEGVNI